MEKFKLNFASEQANLHDQDMICGVVGSGNLEVLVSAYHDPCACEFEITTSATGFQNIWEAVLAEFIRRHTVGGLKFQLNDMGATPAVVSLRLSQAVAILRDE